MDKKFALIASFCLILALGNLIYLPQITSQLKKSQDQYTELSKDFQLLQEELESQLNSSGPRYTGNPFATELWPGQLQSENITGMHWYSYYGGELVNVTDNVLGLGGAALEGDYDTWSLVWAKDFGEGDDLSIEAIDNNGIVYLCQQYDDDIIVVEYDGSETKITEIEELADMLGLFWCYHYSSSITAKYVVFTNSYAGDNFTVYKDGLEVFTHNCSGDIANFKGIWGWAISSNGKYITVIADNTENPDMSIIALLYEGS